MSFASISDIPLRSFYGGANEYASAYTKKMSSFAQRVVNRRRELVLTQEKVAELSGLNQSDISKIERGQILQTPMILGLARALKCNPDWLATEAGEMPAPSGVANGPLAFSSQAHGEHYPQERNPLSNHAKVLGQMYDDLPDDKRLRAKVYARITALLDDAMDGKIEEPLPEPVAVASRKKQPS